jgi:hypothetical protein
MGADQTFVKVDSSTLTAKAADITTGYPTMSTTVGPPCMLLVSGLAARKIDDNYQQLTAALSAGKAEAARLAACLEAAARAYDEADMLAGAAIESGRAPTGSDAVSVNPVLPPAAPAGPPARCTAPPEDPGVDWVSAVAQINSGDQGTSLLDFAHALYKLSDDLVSHGKKFSMGNVHWEGGAAEAAEGALRRHESWLYDLAAQAQTLAKQAQDFTDVHISEHPQHPTQSDVDAVSRLTGSDWVTAYSAKQNQSDGVRRSYANRVNFADLTFNGPPAGAYPSQPVKTSEVAARTRNNTGANAGSPGGNGQPGGSAPSGGEAGPAGTPQPDSASVKPAAAEGDSPQKRDGDQAGGGTPSGGSPSGGSGNGSGGGLPSGPGDHDSRSQPGAGRLPSDAGVAPASAGGGGSGGGGSGGQPLQPAASAPALGVAPAAGGTSHSGVPGSGGGAGGVMGGPMGGMGHGGNRESGKEKKRNPNLSLDETLYVEDRDYTDPVIGHTRRTRIDDPKESK